jgi:hypothetical protein
MMTTSPGFSSRSLEHTFTQLPQRDEALMQHDTDLETGFSNSEPVDHAPDDVHPEVTASDEVEPGFSNGKAVSADDTAEAKVIAESDVEDKAVANKAPAKKTAAKKKG